MKLNSSKRGIVLVLSGAVLLMLFQNFVASGQAASKVAEIGVGRSPGLKVRFSTLESGCESKDFFLSKDSAGYAENLTSLMTAVVRNRAAQVETDNVCLDGHEMITKIEVIN